MPVCFCRAKLVDFALASGKLYEGEGFTYIKESFETGTLHLIGLLSDGGVHSRLDQLQVFPFSSPYLIVPCSLELFLNFSVLFVVVLPLLSSAVVGERIC